MSQTSPQKAAISCSIVSASGDEKGMVVNFRKLNFKLKNLQCFEFRNDEGVCMQKSLADLERIFERFRTALPPGLDKVPKKKFLVAEQKLAEKRKNWAEALVNHLVSRHPDKFEII